MARIRDKAPDANLERLVDKRKDKLNNAEVLRLAEKVKTKHIDTQALKMVSVEVLSPDVQQQLGEALANALKGQIPAKLAAQLLGGKADASTLQNLVDRLANSGQGQLKKAASPELARDLARDKSTPQQALRWTQFVQKTQHNHAAANLKHRDGASPKAEGTSLAEMLGQKISQNADGPGLRAPRLVHAGGKLLSPGQKQALMNATFGTKLAAELQKLGITDPMAFIKAGAMPQGREALSQQLNIPRARLLGMMLHAEMLKIGPGRNGELGMRPEFLGPLKAAGIAMMGTLGALRGLSQGELDHLYRLLRQSAGGFKNAMLGNRPPVKRDLLHWARQAGRKRSDILLADSNNNDAVGERRSSGHDAQEMIQAWYYENLLYDELERARRQKEQLNHEQRFKDDQERERQRQESNDETPWFEAIPEFVEDAERQDDLVCFWVTDYAVDTSASYSERRMYVCIDPASGAIIPQLIEADIKEYDTPYYA